MILDVTSVGDVNVDVVSAKIKKMPERDSQVLVSGVGMSSGGCAANFAKAYAAFGGRARLIGKVGDDSFGKFVREELKGVDLRLSRGTRTGVTMGITFSDDSRTFLTYPGANSELTIKDVDLRLIEGKCLHVASFFLQGLRGNTKRLIDHAHKKRMLVSFDTGWDPAGWSKADKALVKSVLEGVDIFFPNLREGEAITGVKGEKNVGQKLLDLGPKIVVLKNGKHGAYAASQNEFIFIPAYKVKAVDTTGAGDVFDAGFVFGRLRGWGLEKSGKFASAAAALSTLAYGSRGYPTKKEALGLL